ncbi:MAG: hypothetical protein IPG50_34410 [Myxococcales bacterium]|nr:hypothetical protein [Myxococcales bacterium]
MSIRRITISVPSDVAARIKKAAGASPVSAWVTELIEEHLDEQELARRWDEFCREVAPTRSETRRAGELYKRLVKQPKRRRAA